MFSCLNHYNSVSLTGVIDLTAHSISLYDENDEPQDITGTFINKNNIGIAEPVDVHIDEAGNNVITMYEVIGDISDERLVV